MVQSPTDVITDGEVSVQLIAISDIDANDYNPNEMEQEVFDTLVEHVKEQGQLVQPVLVRADGDRFTVVDGEHRLLAAKSAGVESVLSVVVPYSDSDAKFRTISMNQLKGEDIPLKMAKLLADLQKDFSDAEIRRMTGMPDDEMKGLADLMEVPTPDFSQAATIGEDMSLPPTPVNIMLMPGEAPDYEEAMIKAMGYAGNKVVPLIDGEVPQYDKAMTAAFGVSGTKLRNVGLATICRIFNALPESQKKSIYDELNKPE